MKIFIHSGTHWDREWYQTFQGFRYRLVKMFSEVIEQLEANPQEVFHSDGQIVMLEDFLEIRPDWFERLKKLIQNGQIVIGPWYDMPDEFLLSGESLIRNLRKGMKIAREKFGAEPCKNGYICDIFGHTCQTPQIFNSLGLHHTVLGRGLNDGTTPPNFRWQALDGSEVIGYQLRDLSGYLDFTEFAVSIPQDISDDELDVRVKTYFDELIAMSGDVPIVTSFDAGDHSGYRYDTDRYLASLKRVYPDAEIYHTSIDRMNEAQNEYADLMPVRIGELNETTKGDGYYKYLISNTLSSRYPIKKYNDLNQTLLEKWAGPIYGLHLTDIPRGFMDVAEKNLLLNHPHDSICGCSIDQVHRDMMYRFDQTRMIGEQIVGSAHGTFSGDLSAFAVTNNSGDKNELILRLYNPIPYAVKRNVDARIWFENAFPRWAEFKGYEQIAGFKIYDADGNEVPYGITDIHDYNEYFINFDANLTACGITEYKVVPVSHPTRYPQTAQHTALSAKGDYLGIEFHTDGTFDLTDFETGEKYENLLTVLDEGEIGDGWFHCNPAVDRIYTATTAQIGIVEHNCNRIVFEVTQSMLLPVEIRREHGIHRSNETANFNVKHRITLAIHDRFLNIATEIDNNIKDHRLKIRFPSGVKTPTYFSSQPFGLVERKCGEDYSTAEWKEYGCAEKQTSGIVYKSNGKRGLAVLSSYGIHECAVYENGDMDLTYFRSFEQTTEPCNREIDCQILQNLKFNCQIVPVHSDDNYASLYRLWDTVCCPPQSYQVAGPAPQKYRPFMELTDGNIVYSTCNLLDNGHTEVRVFNASSDDASTELLLPKFANAARRIELDGRVIEDLAVENGKVKITLPAWKIATIEVF